MKMTMNEHPSDGSAESKHVSTIEASLRSLAGDWDDKFSSEVSDEETDRLKAAAIALLHKLGNVSFKTTLRWWDGCHCHGHDESVDIEASTPEELGRNLGEQRHRAKAHRLDNVSERAIEEAQWVISASESDRSAAFAAYTRARDHRSAITATKAAIDAASRNLDADLALLKEQQAVYDLLLSDLNDEAKRRRLEQTEALRARINGQKHSLTELQQRLTEQLAAAKAP